MATCKNYGNNDNLQGIKKHDYYKDQKPLILYQILLFLILIAVIIPVSIAECYTDNGLWWGIATIYCVNGSIVLWSILVIIHTIRGYYSNWGKEWRMYYEWGHFFVEIIFVMVGYIVLYNFDETWILILNLITGSWPIVGARCIENSPNYKRGKF